jgi:hypothetical protein
MASQLSMKRGRQSVSSFEFKIIAEPRKPHWTVSERGNEAGEHRRTAEQMIGWRFFQQNKQEWPDELENRYQIWRAAEVKYWHNFLLATDHNPVNLKQFFSRAWKQDIGQRTNYAEFGLMVGDLRDMTRTELGIDDILKSLEVTGEAQ